MRLRTARALTPAGFGAALLVAVAPTSALARVQAHSRAGVIPGAADPTQPPDPTQTFGRDSAVRSSAPASSAPASSGRLAITGAGEIGQRQSGEQAAAGLLLPTARLDGRIQNRVQNRLRNRVDRFYDPTANATRPFESAAAAERAAGQARHR